MRESFTKERLWENTYYRTLERILLASGRLRGVCLDPAAVIRIRKVMDEDIGPRFMGSDLHLGFGSRFSRSPETREGARGEAEIAFRTGIPLGLRTQFNLDVEGIHSRTEAGRPDAQVGVSGEFVYEIGNRYDIRLEYAYQYDEFDEWIAYADYSFHRIVHRHELRPRFVYWLEERTSVDLELRFYRLEENGDRDGYSGLHLSLTRDIL